MTNFDSYATICVALKLEIILVSKLLKHDGSAIAMLLCLTVTGLPHANDSSCHQTMRIHSSDLGTWTNFLAMIAYSYDFWFVFKEGTRRATRP